MDKKYNIITESEHPLKIDKDIQEIQKTVIYYGEQILKELDNISTLLQTIIQIGNRKEKAIEKIKEIRNKKETLNSYDKYMKDLSEYLNKLK